MLDNTVQGLAFSASESYLQTFVLLLERRETFVYVGRHKHRNVWEIYTRGKGAAVLNVLLLSDFWFVETKFSVLLVITELITAKRKGHFNCVTWTDNKVRELTAIKVLHTSLLNTAVIAFKVLPLGSYAPMPAPSPPFKTILELVWWNGFQSCRCIIPDVINVIKMPSFQYFLYLREHKKVNGGYIQ